MILVAVSILKIPCGDLEVSRIGRSTTVVDTTLGAFIRLILVALQEKIKVLTRKLQKNIIPCVQICKSSRSAMSMALAADMVLNL